MSYQKNHLLARIQSLFLKAEALYFVKISPSINRFVCRISRSIEGQCRFTRVNIYNWLLRLKIPPHLGSCVSVELNLDQSLLGLLHSFNFFRVMTLLNSASVACGLAKHPIQRYSSIGSSNSCYSS